MVKRVALLFIALSFFISGCYGGEEIVVGKKGKNAARQVLNLSSSQDIASMDSTAATDSTSFTAMGQVFEGLYRLGKDDKPELGVAKKDPEITESEEGGAVYTFHLREDAKWSDGITVKAQDFVFAWRKALHPDHLSPYATIFGSAGANIANADAILTKRDRLYGKTEKLGVKALTDTTLQVTVTRKTPYFTALLAFPPFYPQPHVFVERQGGDYAKSADHMLYNGPFLMSQWQHGVGWQLTRNPHYWDKEAVHLHEANVKIVQNLSTALLMYQSGILDMAGLTADFVEPFTSSTEFVSIESPAVYFWRFNQEVDALQNKHIRKAIYTAIDRKSLVDILLNNGSKAATYLVPRGFGKGPDRKDFRDRYEGFYRDEGEKEAKIYWQKGLQELGTDRLELDFLTTDHELSTNIATYAKEQLESKLTGLTININKQPWNNYLEKEKRLDYDISAGSGWSPDYPDPSSFLDIFTSDSGNNRMGYTNQKYDALIERAKTETNFKSRWNMLQQAERILIEEDIAIVPIYQSGRALLQKPYVKNYVRHGIGADASLKWVSIDHSFGGV